MRHSVNLHFEADVNYQIDTSGGHVWIKASIPGSVQTTILHCPNLAGIEALEKALAEAKETIQNLSKDPQ